MILPPSSRGSASSSSVNDGDQRHDLPQLDQLDLITVRILEKMTELELGVAAAFSILVVAIVFVVIGAISLFLRLFRQPGAPEMSNILGG